MPEGTSVARTLCLLVELEHLEATLERMIVRWRESDSAAERRERDKPGAERNAAEQGEAERKSQEHLSLGVLFYNERDWDAAIREYREALLLRPDNADTHNNLGDALQAKGDQQGAIREYREALRLRPQLYSEVQTALNSILEPLDRQIGSCDVVCGPVSFLVIPLGTFLWLWLGLRIHWWLALLWGGLAFLVGLVAWLSIVEPILLRRCGVRPFEERFPDASAERPIALSILAEMKPNTTSGRGMLQTHFKDRV